MTEWPGVVQGGCSVYSLAGFIGDQYQDEYSKQLRDKMEARIKNLEPGRSYLLTLNSFQLKAKKLLEDAGFKVLAVCPTAHVYMQFYPAEGSPVQITEKWKEKRNNIHTIYLMGRGFYKPPTEPPDTSKIEPRPKEIKNGNK